MRSVEKNEWGGDKRRNAKDEAVRSVRDVLRRCRLLILFAAVFGVAVNLLLLVGPLYMLQVYDRVLTSGSFETLAALTVLMLFAYAALGAVDYARAKLALRVGLRIEKILGPKLVAGAWTASSPQSHMRGAELLRDLDAYRNFIGGPGLITATDLPFTPLFIAVIFLLHPWLGVFATAAIILLTALALVSQFATRSRQAEAREATTKNARTVLNVSADAESVRALGMAAPLSLQWRDERDDAVSRGAEAAETNNAFKSASKSLRFAVQSSILGLGAYLVLVGELSPGGMIAASIILGRALGPIDMALNIWPQLNAAKAARAAIDDALKSAQDSPPTSAFSLPPLTGAVSVENLTYRPTETSDPILANLNFSVAPGSSVGVIGPSGAGKSTFLRLLAGTLDPTVGVIRVDSADTRRLGAAGLSSQIGYLAQDTTLLTGTVRQNISRFRDGQDDDVLEATQRARVHDLILRLPEGYDTLVGEGGFQLSGGQRQRIGLARAIMGRPKLIILDEPNANLDEVGEAALLDVLQSAASDGATVFMSTHRMPLLESFDALLALQGDRVAIFGPRVGVLKHLRSRAGGEGPRRVLPGPERHSSNTDAD